jgi:quinol-cytochrome oxidoreductase complex cytochrome b subunit
MMRVFFTGAYRRPREVNWMIGMFILGTSLFLGFTGYSLVYEQLSYWGLTVVGNLLESVPMIGIIIADFFRGGPGITQATLSRIFIFHAAILPALLIGLLLFHLLLMHALGISRLTFRGEEREPDYPFVPDHLYSELIFALLLMFVLTLLAIFFPVGLGERANPLVTPPHIKPEWYFYFAFRILKITSLTFAVLATGAGFFIMVLWPLIDGAIRRRFKDSEASVVIGAVVVLLIIFLTIWEVFAAGVV